MNQQTKLRAGNNNLLTDSVKVGNKDYIYWKWLVLFIINWQKKVYNIYMYSEDQISTANIRLIITNEADGSIRQLPCMVPFMPSSRQLRLNQALDDTCRRVYPLYGAQLFHVDFANRMNRFLGIYPFEGEARISYESVVNGSVQINVRPNYATNRGMTDVKEQDVVGAQVRNKKVKERTITEAVQSVKMWRTLYDTDDGKGKRLHTLDEAAQIVGIAKKTLDDYYSLIRTAMNFNFNFEGYKEQKIGLLRKFVKVAKEEGQEGINRSMSQYLYDADITKYWDLSDF